MIISQLFDIDTAYSPEVRALSMAIRDVVKGATVRDASLALKHVMHVVDAEGETAALATTVDGGSLESRLARFDESGENHV